VRETRLAQSRRNVHRVQNHVCAFRCAKHARAKGEQNLKSNLRRGLARRGGQAGLVRMERQRELL
jgi:hypothetical protein